MPRPCAVETHARRYNEVTEIISLCFYTFSLVLRVETKVQELKLLCAPFGFCSRDEMRERVSALFELGCEEHEC